MNNVLDALERHEVKVIRSFGTNQNYHCSKFVRMRPTINKTKQKNGSGLWLVGSGFRDIVDPDIPLVAVLLCVVLRSSEGISPFPLLVQLVEQVGVRLFHSGDLLPESVSLSLYSCHSLFQTVYFVHKGGGETVYLHL